MPAWDERTLNQIGGGGDPAADAAMSTLVGVGDVGRVVGLLHDLVENDGIIGIQLPPELNEFVAMSATLPPWHDPDRISRAQWFFQLWGLQLMPCLTCGALPTIYANPRLAKATAFVLRGLPNPTRWNVQLMQLAVDVLSPQGLDAHDADGVVSAQSFRLRNAAVRLVLRGEAATRPAVWDRRLSPMSQEDVALVVLTLSTMTASLAKLGVTVRPEDADNVAHLWRVVGYLLGVNDQLLPDNAADAAELLNVLRRRHGEPSDASRSLVAGLIGSLDAAAPRFGEIDIFPTLIRHLIDEELAAQLQIPDGASAMWRLSPPLKRLTAFVETRVARRRVLERLAEPVGRELLTGLLEEGRLGPGQPLVLGSQLIKSWDVPVRSDTPAAP